eukprot:gene12263-13528_t
MNFATFLFLYGSPALAVLICILNLTEIIILAKKLKRAFKSREGQRRSPIALVFLINLAISDFSVGLIIIIIKIMYYLFLYNVLPNTKLSHLVYNVLLYLFLRFSLLCSLFNLTALTMDRCLSIQYPLRYRAIVTKGKVFFVVLLSWALSVTVVVVHYHVSFHTSAQARKNELVIFPAAILPASAIFIICYTCILHKTLMQGREIKRLMTSDNLPGSSAHASLAHVFRREAKVSQLACTVACLFVVCWLPMAIVGLLTVCGVHVKMHIINPVFNLAFANSILDPLVYFGFKKRLGTRLKRMLASIYRRVVNKQSSNIHKRGTSTAVFSSTSVSEPVASETQNATHDDNTRRISFSNEAFELQEQ